MHGQEAFSYTDNVPTKSARKKSLSRQREGWKDVKSKKESAKKTKWALIVLFSIFGLIIFGRMVRFTQAIFSPWQVSQTTQRNYRWNGNYNINLLIKAKGISLLTFSPQNQKIILISIPNNIYIEVAHGFGSWEIRSVYDLGGDKLLRDTLGNFFAQPIDGFLDFSSKDYAQKEGKEVLSDLGKNPFSFFKLLSSVKTDLTPFELIKLKIGLSSVRFDKIKLIDLIASDTLTKDKLADGEEILTSDPVKLDAVLSELTDPKIQLEHKTIAIFNSTNHIGLAQKAARLITNLGGDVIITSNTQRKFKTTMVIGEKSKTLERLKQIFENPCQKGKNDENCDKIDLNIEDLVSSRAEINIFLGEDYSNKL